jgi:hypothetical protein
MSSVVGVPVTGQSLEDFLGGLWETSKGDAGVTVALIDGPVDLSHESLREANVAELSGFGSSSGGAALRHGTHVASIIFGQHGGPVSGVAPMCRGLAIPLFSDDAGADEPACSQEELAEAIVAAVESGADIINISAGEIASSHAVHPALVTAVGECAVRGVLVVAAAGDDGCCRPQVPSNVDPVLAVGMVEAPGGSPTTACLPPGGCLLAPGAGVQGAEAGGGVRRASGSSYAAAIVSGVGALLLSLQARAGLQLDRPLVGRLLLDSARAEPAVPHGRILDPDAAKFRQERAIEDLTPGEASDAAAPTDTVATADERFVVSEIALQRKFRGVSAADFGTVTVDPPHRQSYRVADYHYDTAAGRGMHLIPVAEAGPSVAAHGLEGHGSDVLDECLRRAMGLGDEDQIYAILSYIHPEHHAFDAVALPHTAKVQLAHRHVGAYLGRGRTTHVLNQYEAWQGEGPANMGLNVDRHPANVQTLSLKGVAQAVLNRNAYIVDTIVAHNARVPKDADNVTDCRAIDLTTVLQYYRDVIRDADYLEDLAWFTQCTVHKMIVANVFLNLPHNLPAFTEIFGAEGPELWADVKERYELVNGEPFTAAVETSFTPMWKLMGLPVESVRPLSFREYLAYDAARNEDRLGTFPGRRPLKPSAGLAWPLETLVDLLDGFLETYVPFERAGGVVFAAVTLLLSSTLEQRVGVDPRRYLGAVIPVVGRILAAEAHLKGTLGVAWLERADRELYWVTRPAWPRSAADDAVLRTVIEDCVAVGRRELSTVPARVRTRSEAVAWSRSASQADLDELRTLATGPDGRHGYFAGPATFHRLALGLHPKSPFLEVRTVATAMARDDLVKEASKHTDAMQSLTLAGREAPNRSVRGVDEKMDPGNVDQQTEALHVGAVTPLESAPAPPEAPTQSSAPAQETPSVAASSRTTENPVGDGLVYALGEIGYDYPSRSRRAALKQRMETSADPDDPASLLAHLDAHPHEAAGLHWTLNIQGTPIYFLDPIGPFASDTYAALRGFLREQVEEGVERVSIAGIVHGFARHRSGAELPVVVPALPGMYSWTTAALVSSVIEATAGGGGRRKAASAGKEEVQEAVTNFLERVYYELRNLGREPHERALNYAATNAFEPEQVYERALSEQAELDTIEVEPSTVCPPGANCWDVKLIFFYPQQPPSTLRKVYRFTVDVADVVPATVGPMRSWSIR